jgi:hypothetical protein
MEALAAEKSQGEPRSRIPGPALALAGPGKSPCARARLVSENPTGQALRRDARDVYAVGPTELVVQMTKSILIVLYIVVLVVVIVGVDLLFFRNRFWERLISNIGIVLVFVTFYLGFLKNL